jgi:hypothetical protein
MLLDSFYWWKSMQGQQGQRGLHNEGNNASAPWATTPVWQGQWHQHNGTNTAGQLGQQHRCSNGDNTHETWGQRGQCKKDNNASAMRASMPVQCWQWLQCNEGNNTIVKMAKTTAHQRWQWRHCDKGNGTSLKVARTQSQQGQQWYCNNGEDAWTAKMPVHQQRWHHCDEGNNPISMTAKMALHWWWQRPHFHKGNDASLMTTLAWLWQRYHCNKGNNCHCNKSKDACASMATMPSQRGQQCHRDDGKDACALMMTKTPLQQGQWHQLEDSNRAIAKRETMALWIKGDITIVTRVTMPAWWQQGRLRIDNSNKMPLSWGQQLQLQWRQRCLRINGNCTIIKWATTPAQQQAMRATTLAWQWQRRLHIDDGNNNIGTRATITIATMAKTPFHQWQQCHQNKATMPA